MLKSAYNLEFFGIRRAVTERALEDRLIERLRDFILELGCGFCFIGRQHRLTLGRKEYFIDLLFYHRFLKALVAFELKVGPFEPEYAGKMDFYLNLLNDKERGPDDQPSIGVILCAEKDDIEVEYALRTKANPIGVATYELQPRLTARKEGDPMNIGVPKESCPDEERVALVPSAAAQLIKSGHKVLVEAGAGRSAGYPDRDYGAAGALIVTQRKDLFERADFLFMVRGPGATPDCSMDDLRWMRPGQGLIAFLNPLMSHDAARALAATGVTALALELIPRISRAQSMDALSSMASLAGYKGVLLAANSLPKIFPLMMTAAGSLMPAKVFVIGAGVTGLQACATAKRMGALVSAYDIRPAVKEQVQSVGAQFVEFALPVTEAEDRRGYARAQSDEFYRRQREEMGKILADSDVVMATAGVPGKKAPVLITEDMVKGMPPRSVIVDLMADLGGNCALTEPGRTVVKYGVTLIGPTNLPSSVAYHASQMLARNITALFDHITDMDGRLSLHMKEEITVNTLLCRDGEIVNERVRELLDSS